MVASAVLLGIGAGCGSGTTEPLVTCSAPAPETRADGTWRGQLGGRELAVTLKQECSLVFIYAEWVVSGTWTWGVSSGTAVLVQPQLSLKGSPGDFSFRGLTVTLTETPPYSSTLSGSANGELPLTSSSTGAWQTFSSTPVSLTRQ